MEVTQDQVESVFGRIGKLIENRVTSDGGDWPTLTREQVSDFYDLVYDLTNLAFEPDYKERSVLSISISDKKRCHAHHFYEPVVSLYDIIDEKAAYEAFADLSRVSSSMISIGHRILEETGFALHHRASFLKAAEVRANEYEALQAHLDQNNLDEFRKEADRIMGNYVLTYRLGDQPPTYSNVPEELQRFIDQYGAKLPEETVKPVLDQITMHLDLAGLLIGTERFGVEGEKVRKALVDQKYKIGQTVLRPVISRYNRMAEEHRVVKRLAERGKKIVDSEPSQG